MRIAITTYGASGFRMQTQDTWRVKYAWASPGQEEIAMRRQVFSIFSILMIGFPAVAAADIDALMQGCNDCHGENGVSQWSDMPTIAGLSELVHVDALYIYQDEARPCADSE